MRESGQKDGQAPRERRSQSDTVRKSEEDKAALWVPGTAFLLCEMQDRTF